MVHPDVPPDARTWLADCSPCRHYTGVCAAMLRVLIILHKMTESCAADVLCFQSFCVEIKQ